MDMKHALDVAQFAAESLTAFAVILGTLRNLLTHADFISTEERTKIGAALDRCSFVAEKGKKGIAWVLTLPGFASRAKDAPAPDLKLVPLLVAGLLTLTGCPLATTPASATLGQKVEADVSAIKQVAADVKAQCPKLAPLSNLIADAVSVANDPYDLLNDIMTAVREYPQLKQDYDAIKCAVRVVLDDYKAMKPTAKTAHAVTVLEDALVLLNESGNTPALACAR
jgi:hypothetical protein